jgi:hypothetical protein
MRSEFFDFWEHFVLDIANYTSIIYIWYEDGLLKPFLVTRGVTCRWVPNARGRNRVSVPGGSH